MAMTIGRATGLRPQTIQRDGDNLSVEGTILAGSAAEVGARWQQLRGLVDNADEPVVPLTWDVDPSLDGFYSVRYAQVRPFSVEGGATGRFLVGMQRVVSGYQKPLIELHASCVEVANAHSLTTYGRLGHPQNDIEDYNAGPGFGEYNVARNTVVDGGRIRWTRVPSLPSTGVSSYYVPPANHYIGASTLEVNRGGTYYAVQGRQMPALETAGAWRLTNGLVRITPSGSYYYLVQFYDTNAWVDLVTIQRGYDDSGWNAQRFSVNDPQNVTWTGEATRRVDPILLRNGPERVTVRIPQWGGYEDLSILRGAGWIEISYAFPGAGAEKYGIGSSTTTACSDEGNRAHRTSLDGNGNAFFLAIPQANTVDTTNGRIYLDSAATSLKCMVGVNNPAIDSTTAEYLYAFTANGVTARIVPR